MEIRSRLSGNILKLKLRGRLDSASAEDFYSYLKSKWEEGIRKFLFSCEELEYIESEGISVLARFENFLKSRGASSAYCAFNEECKTLLSFLGFGKSIAFFEDPARAEEYLSLIKIQDQRSSQVAPSAVSKIKKNSPVQFYSSGSQKVSGSGGSHSIYIPEIRTVPETEGASDSGSAAESAKPTLAGTSGLASQSKRLQAFLNEEKEEATSSDESGSMPKNAVTSFESSAGAERKEGADVYSAKSALEKAIRTEKNFPKRIIYCGACSSRIRVSKPGRYQCPACQIQFDLNTMGGVRYLEKLLGP
ncbi:STAS domain-containing protein [Leptospira yasudae]|uniref:Anti-sigma factor antagonist n=1 Tax=Leptospira yasudae TaxID=2202201 RepID=A0A6N4QQM4_9LEPT|nr:STAS domain-containing protein [Leptospira yasudae]TGL80313.1 anti-sigma factor antagonist [Leptospira yasudae]TGL81912.1 anti-sigma factor antagonist [Leptospira yasudae]TGL89585.1 anti-sigma factor antagonist [Leptospira yasudae]